MTPEEIEKAAEEYATNLDVSTFDYNAAKKDFREGAKLADKKWQEKTRWILIEEQLPPKKSETRQVFVKNADQKINWMIVSCFDGDYTDDIEAVKASFTHWKEIEL